MDVDPLDEEDVVKTALKNLNSYLHNSLRIDTSLISGLKRKQLLDESSASQLEAKVRGGEGALDGLLDYMSSYYDEEILEKFCSFLDDSSKPAKPRLHKIAQKIRDEMKKLHPTPTHPAETVRDVESQSTAIDLPSSPPTTQGESTSAVSTGDERSQKIKEIVEIYRSNEKVHLPRVPDLEDAFDDIMVTLGSNLLSADPKIIDRLHTKIRLKYRRYIHGVRSAPLPDVINTPRGLLDFVVEKSNAYEILLVRCAVDELKCVDLKDALKNYEEELAMRLRTKLLSFKRVVLPSRKDHTHMAIVLRNNPELVLLSLAVDIKEYLVKMLQLEEALFEGFAGGCTILFFSILTTDAVLLSPKVISHLSELKRMFEITHLVVFGYFACDLEQASVEVLSEGDGLRQEVKKAEEKSEQLQLELTAAKSEGEQLQHELIAAKMKLKLKEEELTKAKEESDMYKNSTVELAKQKFELERQIVNVKGSLCKDHLETIEELKRSLEETASSLPDVLQVEKALLSASEKFKEELSVNKVKLEEQLSLSKEELSSLRSAYKELEDIPSPIEEQKEILSGHKVKVESLESTVSSVQLEYDKAVLKLKCCEMDVLRELPLKEEIGYMLQERTEKIEAIIISTLKAKQEKLERDEYLHEVMEREKREALLKEENEKLKADLEHQREDLSDRYMKLSHQHEELKLEHAHNIAKYEEMIEKSGQEIKELKSELKRMSKENSELRLLLEKEGQNKSEPNEENRISIKSKDDSQRVVEDEPWDSWPWDEYYVHSQWEEREEEWWEEESRGYYKPCELNQDDADKELQKKATNGEHLVWKEGEGDLKLGIWQDGTCYHLQIYQKQDEASRVSYSLDEKVYFDSIKELCNHYKREPLPGYLYYHFKLCW